MIYVFLADGFEETEALTTVDFLRRAKLMVQTVGIGSKTVTSSHKITVVADIDENDFDKNDLEAVILPGGMPGTLNLEKSATVISAVKYAYENNKYICAICAAPSILGHLGMLDNRHATCFPGFETNVDKVNYTGEPAVTDGKVITGKGAGCAIDFAYNIVCCLKDKKTADDVCKSMQC